MLFEAVVLHCVLLGIVKIRLSPSSALALRCEPHVGKTGLRRFLGIWGDVGFRIYIQGSGTQGLLEASELHV